MEKDLVSIIIPTYNRAKDLNRSLRSIRNQTYKNLQVIVVDNSSVDETDEVVDSFSDLRISIYKIQNQGVIAVSRNLGIQKAEGEFVAFLDADDWWAARKLEESVRNLKEKKMDFVYHDLYKVYSNDQKFFRKKERTRNLVFPVLRDLIVNGNAINNSSVVLRKSVIDSVGLLDENPEIVAGEDYDYWMRIAKVTDKFYRIPKTLGFYWIGGGNISNPKRTLNVIEAIKKKYQSEFERLIPGEDKTPLWFHKSKILVYLSLGEFENAKQEVAKLKNAPVKTKWKYFVLFYIKNFLHSILNR
ncbi:glycosyltransferase [Leptospira yasudae]|uniref:glycosyltransferase family 2 protein n=1 Tax=Leptospira yasudae TaxID=2202201 RepID=UPI001C4FB347|nr:glycosyltransferase [Leptospira yasudae]MBW0434137.1 glycosyltransferase [Leptospira yasudae]